MQQTEPMPDFMHGRLALIVHLHAAAGHAGEEDVAPVGGVVARAFGARGAGALGGAGGAGYLGGEFAVAEEEGGGVGVGAWGGEVGLEVDVEAAVGAFAEGGFHRGFIGVGGPAGVDVEGWGLEVEADADWGVGAAEGVVLGTRVSGVQ